MFAIVITDECAMNSLKNERYFIPSHKSVLTSSAYKPAWAWSTRSYPQWYDDIKSTHSVAIDNNLESQRKRVWKRREREID